MNDELTLDECHIKQEKHAQKQIDRIVNDTDEYYDLIHDLLEPLEDAIRTQLDRVLLSMAKIIQEAKNNMEKLE